MSKSYKELMPKINTFIFDVDGVLTDGSVHVFENGELVRQMNVKDGYALKCAIDTGFSWVAMMNNLKRQFLLLS